MRIKLSKLIPIIAGMIALFIFLYNAISPGITTAQTSFAGNLPPGYAVYPGKLEMGKLCSCSTGGITGAPPQPPPCAISPCYGSSNTQYGRVSTTIAGINSTFCDQLRKSGKAQPPCFQLDGDDALVLSGSLSSVRTVSYYSFTLYQSFTYNNRLRSNYYATQSSVNLGLNNSNLKLGTKGQYVLIVTANTNTLNTIKQALRVSGVPDEIINTYLIPASVANLGVRYYPDQLSFLLRLTPQGPKEKEQVQAFVQQEGPATKIAFVKGPGINGDVTFDNLPKWENTLRTNSVEYTTGLAQNLKALEAAVLNKYTQQGYKLRARLTEGMAHSDPNECRATPKTCVYDSPDALYTFYPCDFSQANPTTGNCTINLSKRKDDMLMLLGVDHSLVGKKTLAAYFSLESKPYPSESEDGTFSFVGLYTQGSATQYLPPNKATNLYAVKVTRACGNDLYCTNVPYLGSKPGAAGTGFYLIGRVYLDKVTGSAPNPANLVPGVLLWLTKS